MLTNYLKIAIRNLRKNALFSFINISGMAISLASFFVIGLFVLDEWKYDRQVSDAERIFRVYNIRTGDDGSVNYYPIVPIPFATYMQKDFPEIESTLRLCNAYEQVFEVGATKVTEPDGLYAEPGIFDMLSLKTTAGSPATALEKPRSIALSLPIAEKYFGKRNALGETIRIDDSDYQVTAVYENPDGHFHLSAPYLLSFSTMSSQWKADRFENWQFQQFFTYLKLKPGTDARALEDKFLPFVEKYAYPKIRKLGFAYVPHLQNILDIHLHSTNFEWDVARHGNAQMVYILSITAALLLIIACLNFINLSTARSVKRMKEVGVRKVTGAVRSQLVLQFVSESVVVTLSGMALAVVLCEMAFPLINRFAEKNLSFPTDPLLVACLLLFSVLLGIIAGSYPAFYLSKFRPAVILRSRTAATGRNAWFRQGMVVFQFMLSFFLIIGSSIVLSQNNLIRNKDLGFSKEQLVAIPLRNAQLSKQQATKNEFSRNSNIINSTICFGIPGDIAAGDEVIDPTTHTTLPSTLYCTDQEYVKTMGMHIVAGRDFSRDIASDETEAFLLNETAVKAFGFSTPQEAIGRRLDWKVWGGKDSLKHGSVVGVVQDFHFKSFREKVTPVVIQVAPAYSWKLVVRIRPDHIPETMAFLKSTYEKLDPGWPFTYQFVDENIDSMYRSEEKLSVLFTVFTSLAILVACMGLFGLVEFSVNQRTKEISIRKVFGAPVYSILIHLTQNYFGLIAIAFLIVIPVSYYVASQWLDRFAYHVSITPWMYLEAAGIILLITLFTVSFQSLKAAVANPTNALRNE